MPATDETTARLALARELADDCPAGLASELAVTGSVARRLADEDSDLELRLWAPTIPSLDDRLAWLRGVGASQVTVDAEPVADGSVWITFRYHEFWVEAGWQATDEFDRLLAAVLVGRITDHDRLVVGWAVRDAAVLRSTGRLEAWQQQLASYPQPLIRTLIRGAVLEPWTFPHLVDARWALARRRDLLPLAERLVSDLQGLLRMLYAVNHVWEPEWKWLAAEIRRLQHRPARLLDRIDGVLVGDDPALAVRNPLQLALNTLDLLSELAEVANARAIIQQSLARHPQHHQVDGTSSKP